LGILIVVHLAEVIGAEVTSGGDIHEFLLQQSIAVSGNHLVPALFFTSNFFKATSSGTLVEK